MKIWNCIYRLVCIVCFINILSVLPTLQRWKWGYWSIDLIPPILILFFFYLIDTEIKIHKLIKKINELK